jgi:hypothetical protein
MKSKIKTMTVETWETLAKDADHKTGLRPLERVWRVVKLTDSTDYNPKQMLTKNEIDGLCASRDWKVTIVNSGNV